jgi:2,3-dihydroxybenzoate decarboxylase
LPAADPQASADELERAVTRLGFKGAMVHGFTLFDGQRLFIDDRRFWPIFERAQALEVPIYVHPARPHPAVTEAYYQDYADEFPEILTAGWGFTVETATQVVRLVLSKALEAYPSLRFIVGHMGESVPFSLWRIDKAISRGAKRRVPFRDLFCEHFYITTSGNFSSPALLCSVMEMGADRILFSVDYPYEDNREGVEWMKSIPLCAEDRKKILHENAARLLKL